jgi:hypothetical protein
MPMSLKNRFKLTDGFLTISCIEFAASGSSETGKMS